MSNEEKQFYRLQIDTNGKLGYCTSKTVSLYPSKVRKPVNKENIYTYPVRTSLCEENSDTDENTECVSLENMKKRKKQPLQN